MEVRLYDSARDADQLRIFNAQIFGASTENSAHLSKQPKAANPYGETPGPIPLLTHARNALYMNWLLQY